MNHGPKLFTNKPKKAKLKASTPITTESPPLKGAPAPPPPPPTPPPQNKPFFQRYRLPLPPIFQRYRFLVPIVLVVNFSIGAYTLFRVRMRDKVKYEEEMPDHPTSGSTSTSAAPTSTSTTAPALNEKPVIPVIMEPVQREPIPEDQRHELFKWMLEEKRKVKPRDALEKKRIDEDKAILKQFIRAKSLPT